MSVFVFFWALHLLLAPIWRWEFIPAIPVSIFHFQVLNSQALKPSPRDVSYWFSSPLCISPSEPENPLSSPTWIFSVTQLKLKWTRSPRVHPPRSASIMPSPLAHTYDHPQHFIDPSHGCLQRKSMALPPGEQPSYTVIPSVCSPISH